MPRASNETPSKIPRASNKTPHKIPGPKIPMPNLWAFNISRKGCTLFAKTTRPGYAGTTPKASDCFDYPKNPFLNKASQKMLVKVSYQKKKKKNPRMENFKHKKILRSSQSFEIRSSPPPPPSRGFAHVLFAVLFLRKMRVRCSPTVFSWAIMHN